MSIRKLRSLELFWTKKQLINTRRLTLIQRLQRKQYDSEEQGLGPILDWSGSIIQQKIILRKIIKQEAILQKKCRRLSKGQSHILKNQLMESTLELMALEQEHWGLKGIILSLKEPVHVIL
jgi:hypothetical protein